MDRNIVRPVTGDKMTKKTDKKTSRSDFVKTAGLSLAGFGLSFVPIRQFLSKDKNAERKRVEVTPNEFAVKRNNNKG